MAYLMHIGFDNNNIFWKNIFYFEYKGIKFKFIQDKRKKWSNVLITIIKGQNNSVEENIAYNIASEYLSALAWEHNSVMKVWHSGNYGAGIPEDIKLSKARRVFFNFQNLLFMDILMDVVSREFQKLRMKNKGMRLFCIERHEAPTTIIYLFYFFGKF